MLALFLLVAMFHGLRAQIRETYTAASSDGGHLPDQPVELSADALAAGEFDMLVHVVAGTFHAQNFFPFEMREFRLPWPEGQGEPLTVEMKPAGRDVKVTIHPGDIQDWSQRRHQPGHHMMLSHSHEISQRGGGSATRSIRLPGVFQVFHRSRVPLRRHPYSPVPGLETDLAVVGVITPIAEGDPGRPVSIEAFLHEHAGDIRETLTASEREIARQKAGVSFFFR